MIISDKNDYYFSKPDTHISLFKEVKIYVGTFEQDGKVTMLWRTLLFEISVVCQHKKIIKYIKRKDPAPRHFLRRILNYIKQ